MHFRFQYEINLQSAATASVIVKSAFLRKTDAHRNWPLAVIADNRETSVAFPIVSIVRDTSAMTRVGGKIHASGKTERVVRAASEKT